MSSDAKLYILFGSIVLICVGRHFLEKEMAYLCKEPGSLRTRGWAQVLYSLICKVVKTCLGGPKASGNM